MVFIDHPTKKMLVYVLSTISAGIGDRKNGSRLLMIGAQAGGQQGKSSASLVGPRLCATNMSSSRVQRDVSLQATGVKSTCYEREGR